MTNLDAVLDALRKNGMTLTARKARKNGDSKRSKIGGRPVVPAGFVWPRFESENFEGETANRPLSFLCQINLEEVSAYDRENLLPKTGMLLFFYEQESEKWGFDPADNGCARVYYFEHVSELDAAEFPEDLQAQYRVKEYDLSFTALDSYPSYEELELHSDVDCDWDEYDEAVEMKGCEILSDRHKLLGYADLVQGEMLTECERTARGLYCGDSESYKQTSEETKADIRKKATEWILLFQMSYIQEDDFEMLFGDCGKLYFYIRKQDLQERNFDRIWLILRCG